MARKEADILRLIGELSLEADNIAELSEKNKRAEERITPGSKDELDYMALGYTIHK